MNVLSLFDGISCGRVALERAGIKVDTYYASEIDKYAIKITQKNYPDTVQLGDVNDIDFTKFTNKIDLLLGGSPCTDLSIAKKNREGLKGKNSSLFWKYAEALNTIKPKWFIFENVASMKKEDKDIITKTLGVEPIMIDSALVSAQQRKRLYWTNIPGVQQPEDKHIYLQDILESGYTDRLKSYCIDASYFKGTNLEQYLEKKRRQVVFEKPFKGGQFNSGGQGDRVYAIEGKSVTLSANGGGRGAKTGLYLVPKICCAAQRGRYNNNGEIEQQYEPRFDRKTNALTTVQKDNMILNAEELYIRKLTPIECERLQTLPDNYTEGISNTQRYKCIGNGWTVDVIVHILKHINY